MPLNQKHALGREQKFFAVAEATFGTFVKPVSADALKVLTSTMEYAQERVQRNDARQTRSYQERITRRKTGAWSAEAFLLPGSAVDSPPDIGPLLVAAMGIETITGATDVAYTLSGSQTALGSLSLYRHLSDVLGEAIVGAWVESLTLSIPGGEEPKISFEGGGADHVHTGPNGLLDGAEAAAQTVIRLGAGQAADYDVGSMVAFVNPTTGAVVDDNTGAGYEVTLVDDTLDDITVTPALAVGAGAGDRVVPFAPTETTAGSPIAGINGSVLANAFTLPVTAVELTMANNNKAINDEFGQEKATCYIPGPRDVTGSMTLRARRDEIIQLGIRKKFTSQNIVVTIGDTAAVHYVLSIPTAEFDFSAVEVPESEEGTFSLPFRALGTAAGEDEFSLTQQ